MLTVNVVEVNGDGLVIGIRSFPETEEGNRQAEALFSKVVEEITDETAINDILADGYCDVPGGGSIQLVHSNV